MRDGLLPNSWQWGECPPALPDDSPEEKRLRREWLRRDEFLTKYAGGEPGFPTYDDWEDSGWNEDWRDRIRGMSPDEIAKLTPRMPSRRVTPRAPVEDPGDFIVDFGREAMPKWVVRLVREVRLALSPTGTVPTATRRPAQIRPRSRTSHRTSSPTRGSPDDDGEADADPVGARSRNPKGRRR